MPDPTNEGKVVPVTLTSVPDKANISRNDKQPQVVDRGSFKLVQKFFAGAKAGFSYFVIEYKNGNEQEANASIETMLKKPGWNATKLVDLVNQSIVSSLRAKATNAITFDEAQTSEDEIKAELTRLLRDDPCLVSPQQAEDYTPGERDARTIGGKMKILLEYGKELSENKDIAPDIKANILKEMHRLKAEIDTEIASQLASFTKVAMA